jgi:hypothetical protein
MSETILIHNNCPTHGDSDIAHSKFWSNPYTSHWQCRCKNIGRSQAIDGKPVCIEYQLNK